MNVSDNSPNYPLCVLQWLWGWLRDWEGEKTARRYYLLRYIDIDKKYGNYSKRFYCTLKYFPVMNAGLPEIKPICVRINDRYHEFRVTQPYYELLLKINHIDDHSYNPALQNNFKRSFIRDAALLLPEEDLDPVFEICSSSILGDLIQHSETLERSKKDEMSGDNMKNPVVVENPM